MVLFSSDSHVLGAILVLVGAVVVVVALTADRLDGAVETVLTWLQNLP